MATPVAPSQDGSVSQHPTTPVTNIVRQQIDMGGFEIGVVDNTILSPEAVSEEQPNSQETLDGNTQETVDGVSVRKSRAKARFAKQKILANRDLFLNPTCRGCFTDAIVEIAGKIEECPRAVNQHRFRIDWRKNNGQPLPPGLLPEYFQEYLPNTSESKEKLLVAMERFSEVYGAGQNAKPVTANIDGKHIAVGTGYLGKQTPPKIARGRAAAAASTAANSTISSFTDGSSSRRYTRSQTAEDPSLFDSGVSSDIEDGDELDDEDDYQLRFVGANPVSEEDSDCEEELDKDNDNTSDDSTSGDDDVRTKGTVTQILQKLLWHFERLEKDTVVKDTSQPEYYEGSSGLKPGVEQLFSDPFECLGVAGGLDYKFIARLAKNSNEYARKHLLNDRNNWLQRAGAVIVTPPSVGWKSIDTTRSSPDLRASAAASEASNRVSRASPTALLTLSSLVDMLTNLLKYLFMRRK